MRSLHISIRYILAVLFVGVLCSLASAQSNLFAYDAPAALAELGHNDKAMLVVMKSSVISADQPDRPIIEMVRKAQPEPGVRHKHVYGTLARKLNKYIRKHQSLSAATDLGEADFVIFFSLIEYRRILDTRYPFGELFIIVKGEPKARRPPRIIWRTRKVLSARDAIDEFIRELKNTRGEG